MGNVFLTVKGTCCTLVVVEEITPSMWRGPYLLPMVRLYTFCTICMVVYVQPPTIWINFHAPCY